MPSCCGALADRDDAARARAHRVVDDDAALHLEPGLAGEADLGPDPDRDDDEIGVEPVAAGELEAVDAAVAR